MSPAAARLLQAALDEIDEVRLDDRGVGEIHRERRRIAFPHRRIAMQPGDQLADHAAVDHRCETVIRGRLHDAFG
jgi:hypothetical protein